MDLFAPFNGEDDLIPVLSAYPEVKEIYGKLTADFIGGGKHSFQTPLISKVKIIRTIGKAHAAGMKFNYLLNSSCLDNREWTIKGQREITRLLDWISDIGVDSVTVAVPYLLQLIKKRYPRLHVYVSTLAGVDSVRKAQAWERMGADRITLLNTEANRNFAMLRRLVRTVKCGISVIVNANCLYECPFYMYHANLSAHSSQSAHPSRGFVIDYCRMYCRCRQIEEPVNFIRSSWIRPEDLRCYEEMGIGCFKIIDRNMSTEAIASTVDAYVKRSYEGNLLDLFPNPSKSIMFNKLNLLPKARYFFRPFTVNVFKLRKFAGLFDGVAYIDNKSLDGFLEKVKAKHCEETLCAECGYCLAVAQETVKIDQGAYAGVREKYKDCLDSLVSGDIFKY